LAAAANALKKFVEAAIDQKVAEYKRIAYAFIAGVVFVLSLPLLDHLLNGDKIIASIKDQVIQIEPKLARILGPPRVALSYSNQYLLNAKTSQQQFAFYATKGQQVKAYVQILHFGPDPQPADVSISLDERVEPLWHGRQDLTWKEVDLTDELNKKGVISAAGPANVRFLVFRATYGTTTTDSSLVSVILNVIGFDLPQQERNATAS
jgi:hypothetical protein